LLPAATWSPNFDVYDRNVRLQPDESVVYAGVKALQAPARLGSVSYIPDIGEKQTDTWKGRVSWLGCAASCTPDTTAI
jgi:hypothetical protein